MKKKANPQNKVIVERVIDEELPPGWVKEIRIKKSSNGVRRDPFYNDTTTGYVFRSRLEVFRYLETGEISKHAYKRKDGGRIDIQSMQETPSAATVKSNNNKGKGTLEGSLSPNHGNSKVRETGSDIVFVGNNALLDLGADVDVSPNQPQKPEANENDVVCMDCDPKNTKSKQKSNNDETASSRRSSNRLAGVETELVTHTVAIERVLRAANKKSTKNETMPPSSEPNQAAQSQQAPQANNVVSQEDAVPSKNEIVGADQMKLNEQCGVSTSKRKPERSRKKIVSPRQSSNMLAEIEAEPVTVSMPTKRVLRSATTKSVKTECEQVKDATQTKSAKTEAIPFHLPEQSKQVEDVTPIVNVGSEEDIVRQHTEETPIVNVEKEEETKPATIPVKNELLVAQRIEDNEECGNRRPRSRERKPKRNRKEIVSPITHTTKRVLRSESNKSAKIEDKKEDAPLAINSQEIVPAASVLLEDQAAKETSWRSNVVDQTVIEGCTPVEPSRNNVEVERIKETPPRNNVEVERMKGSPKNNSKDLVVTDEVTAVIESNGKEKEKEEQDSQFSFPWSDPCIEFAYKTLTGVLPLDDTLAIHDYVQHQIRTSSHTTKNFTPNNTVPSNSSTSITFPDPGPPGFSRVPLVDTMPPGFSLNDVPPENLVLRDSGPPGFSRANGNMPPGFSRSSIPPNSSNNYNFTLPDARPPPNSGNNPPVFPWSTVPPAVPDSKPPGFPWDSVNNPDPKPAGPPGFPCSSVPSNSGNNPALPDAKPPGFSWSCIPPNSGIGINLNVALPDSAPPGFSQKILPSSKQQQQQHQQHQQQTNPAGIASQPADFPFHGTMFSWNHRN